MRADQLDGAGAGTQHPRGFKRRAAANTERLGALVNDRIPELPAELGEPPVFAAGLGETLTNLLAGLLARGR